MESSLGVSSGASTSVTSSVRNLLQNLASTQQHFDWVSVPFLVLFHVGAVAALFEFTPARMAVAFLLYVVTGLGITVGFHRLLTHRSFEAPRWLEYLLALAGTLALQNGPITWVAMHRQHHLESDTPMDPHNINKGFFYAHMLWMLRRPANELEQVRNSRLAPELVRVPFYCWLEKFQIVPTLVLGLILIAVGGWPLLLWGFCVRVVFLYHCTWLVNSAAHMWGSRPYANFKGANNWWVALLTFGEGWHNNHHAFPTSARHGLKLNQIDVSWMVIKGLSSLGLARAVKQVSSERR